MNKVSILVAVYNGEKWLKECLESLLAQTYSNIEVVCVDDASTDASLAIIQKYAAEHSNIKFIVNDVNCGQAVSRNKAIELSTGDYIMMVDCDDFLSNDAVESAVKVLDNNADTGSVLLRLVYYDDATGSKQEFVNSCTSDVLDGAEAMRVALDWGIHGLYLARRELYDRFPFDTSARLYSDDNTSRRHYLHSGNVRFCDGVYFYCRHDNSMTNNPGIHTVDWIEALVGLKAMLVEENQPNVLVDKIEFRIWESVVSAAGYYWRNYSLLSEEQRQNIRQRIACQHSKMEYGRLPLKPRMKFGFIPFKSCFGVFMLQERLYFFLRKVVRGI
ncbi:MAG: glycosyltransferase family 2 protein [Bacteroidaceae bacterium]|nr:glycosyltransferase family 2 protein [Bacteroidaceae bacterium]